VGFPDTGILCVLVSGNFWVYNGFVDQRCRAVGGWVGAGTSTVTVRYMLKGYWGCWQMRVVGCMYLRTCPTKSIVMVCGNWYHGALNEWMNE